jgi:O-antigen/teichoic acid export membrane protein
LTRPGPETIADEASISGSSLWIAAGQQLASGFDLVIISVILGSEEAAAYGLVTRLVQFALIPIIGAVPVLTQSAGRARASGLPRARKAARSLTLLVAGTQTAGMVAFVVLGGWASRLLSGGHIAPPTSLLLATAGWGVTETLRRCLMSASATPPGLSHWRRANLGFALPNLALSVLLTEYVGVSGPMLGSLIAVGAMVVVASWSLRPALREALGR